MKNKKSERKWIGSVGVDSGQLMIMDPCYVSSQWVEKGSPIALKFWGQGQEDVAELLKKDGYLVIEVNHSYQIESVDLDYLRGIANLVDQYSKQIGKTVVFTVKTDNSYDRISELTLSENQAGSLPYLMGHEGLAVAFRSGLGDGLYNVFAHYKTFDGWGERITKVEIELIPDDFDEEE